MRRPHKSLDNPISLKNKSDDLNTYDLHRTLPSPLHSSTYDNNDQATEPKEPMEKVHKPWKKIITSIAIFLIVISAGYGGWIGWKLLHNFGWNSITSLFDNTKLKGEDQGRVNILLVGYSADDPGHAGADLTDSIMLVSVDTKSNKAFTLSIPRDLYVNIPNYSYAKINEAYEDGNGEKFSSPGYPAGGMGLLEEVISQKLNVTINYYGLIDYTAFRDAVNAAGGVTINIQSTDPRGLYDPNTSIKLPNGMVTLDGQQALNLARARGDGYGSYGFPRADFDRTANQRKLLIALSSKATSLDVLSNPVKVGNLFDAIGKNVVTDFQLNEVHRLYTIMKKIPGSQIQSASLNDATFNGKKNVNLLQSYRTFSGQSSLVPASGVDDYTQIDAYISQLESNN